MRPETPLVSNVKAQIRASLEPSHDLISTLTDEYYRIEHVNPKSESNVIVWCEADLKRMQQIIREQKEYFAAKGKKFEWKYNELFNPPQVKELLQQEGFQPSETEQIMVLDCNQHDDWEQHPSTNEVRELDAQGMKAIRRLMEEVYQEDYGPFIAELIREKEQIGNKLRVFGVFAGGQMVSSGWMRCFPKYGVLFGGATLPAARGHGCYRDLVRQRLIVARRSHFDFIMVEAGSMSFSILKRLGFANIGETVPFHYEPY